MFSTEELLDRLYDTEKLSDLRIKEESWGWVLFGVKRSSYKIKVPTAVIPEISYLAGAIAGDGSFYYHRSKDRAFPRIKLVITSGDVGYLQLLNSMFIGNFSAGGKIRKEPRRQSCYNLYINHRVIWLYFRNVLKLDKRRLEVPREITNANTFRFFLAGLFDTDGYCDNRGIFGIMLGGKNLSFLKQIVKYSRKFYDLEFSTPRVNVLKAKNKEFRRAYIRLKKSHSEKFASIIPLLNEKYGPVRDRTADLRCFLSVRLQDIQK